MKFLLPFLGTYVGIFIVFYLLTDTEIIVALIAPIIPAIYFGYKGLKADDKKKE